MRQTGRERSLGQLIAIVRLVAGCPDSGRPTRLSALRQGVVDGTRVARNADSRHPVVTAHTRTPQANPMSSQYIALLVLLFAPAAQAAQQLDSLSDSARPRGGRVVLSGAGFGPAQGTRQVRVAGLSAPVASWSDATISIRVPEAAPFGPVDVVVVDGGSQSNALPLEVSARPSFGRVRWRVPIEGGVRHRPAVAPDGSVYVNDTAGLLYALDADGALRWIFDTQGQGAEGPVAIAADGTLYVASDPLGAGVRIFAVNPDGSERWSISDPASQGMLAGPNVGPDGKIYAVTDFTGLGAVALSPSGQVVWNEPGFAEQGQFGQDIVFGAPGRLYFCLSGFFESRGLDGQGGFTRDVGAVQRQVSMGPNGNPVVADTNAGANRMRGFDTSGSIVWTYSPIPTSTLSSPDHGPNGDVFFVRNGSTVTALDSAGNLRWAILDDNSFDSPTPSQSVLHGPVVDPAGTRLVIGGSRGFGQAGVIEAFDVADGASLFELELPFSGGGRLIPGSRPRFSVAGDTAFVGVNVVAGNGPSWLYALDVASAPDPNAYCRAGVHSDGGSARIGHAGSLRVSANDFTLIADGAAGGRPGLFFYGTAAVDVPFGPGFRCAAGTTRRLNPPVQTSVGGLAQRRVDFTQPPASSGAGAIVAGVTRYFQLFFRDGSAAGFNLSDGLAVTFLP